MTGSTAKRRKSAARLSGLVVGGIVLLALGDLLEPLAYLLVPFTWIPAVRRRLEARDQTSAPVAEPACTEPGAVTPPEPEVAGETLTLRTGLTGPGPRSAILAPAVLVAFAAVAMTVATPYIGLPPWTPYAVMAGAVVVGALGVVLFLVTVLALSEATVTIGRHRLALRHGSISTIIVERCDIATGQDGRRWITLCDDRGRRRVLLPVRRRHAEVLATLQTNGWPVTRAIQG